MQKQGSANSLLAQFREASRASLLNKSQPKFKPKSFAASHARLQGKRPLTRTRTTVLRRQHSVLPRAKNVLKGPLILTPATAEFTKRLHWSDLAIKPATVVVSFEGVLGDYYKHCLWRSGTAKLRFRPQAAEGLRTLYEDASVVLLLSFKQRVCMQILNWVLASGLPVQAVYKRRRHKDAHLQSYAQILADCQGSKVVCVSAVTKDMQEDMHVYEKHASVPKRLCLLHAALEKVPSLLVPHSRLCKKVNAQAIAEAVVQWMRSKPVPVTNFTVSLGTNKPKRVSYLRV